MNTICRKFKNAVEKNSSGIALFGDGVSLTYHALDQITDSIAVSLYSHSQNTIDEFSLKNTVIGLSFNDRFKAIIMTLATLKAGAAFLPIDPDFPKERKHFIVKNSQLKLIISDYEFYDELKNGNQQCSNILFHELEKNRIDISSISEQLSQIDGDSLAYVIYTSGTTGEPKGVLIEHHSVVNLVKLYSEKLDLGVGDRTMQYASLSFDASVWEIFASLLSGATLYVPSKLEQRIGKGLVNFLNENQITNVLLPPTVLQTIIHERLPSMRVMITGGEACTPYVIENVSDSYRLYNAYGPTEATVISTIIDCAKSKSASNIGSAIDGVTAYALNEQMEEVPVGTEGELFVGGLALARGYLNNSTLTNERFINHPKFNSLYKTGDRVMRLPNGEFNYRGRADRQIKLRGYRIELAEIENTLMQHVDILQAHVCVIGDNNLDKQLLAFVVSTLTNTTVDEKEIKKWLAIHLTQYMIPARIFVLDNFPLTTNGKVDESLLLEKYHLMIGTSEKMKPTTYFSSERENVIAEIWKDKLNLHEITHESDFYNVGGNSLQAMEICAELSDKLQVEIGLEVLLMHSQFCDFCEEIFDSLSEDICN